MFLQFHDPQQGGSCLRFLWSPSTKEPVQIYEYQLHVFEAKSSPTCANFAIKRMILDNKEMYATTAKAKPNDFYMDDFIKSIENHEEEI